jgi:hypothetical protein
MRLVDRGGRIALDGRLLGKHLKRWTLVDMIKTDFGARGVPWVGLLLRRGSSSTALNLGWTHRATAAISVALLAALARRRLSFSGLVIVLIVLLNRPFYGLLFRQRGAAAAAAGIPLHVVHHLAAVAAVPVGVRDYLLGGQSHLPGVAPRSS